MSRDPQPGSGPLLAGLLESELEHAVGVGSAALTAARLRAAAGALAGRLGKGRIALWAEPSLEAIVTVVAALSAGVELVPVNPKLGRAELEHVLADSEPALLAGAPAELPGGAGAGIPRLAVELDASGELPAEPADPELPALIVYTSGTTGPPKGVVLPRRALATNIDALARAWRWSAADRLVHALPIFHLHGLALGTIGALRIGCRSDHLGRFDPAAIGCAFQAGATMLFAVPTMYHRLAAAAERDERLAAALGRARLLVSGSAALAGPDLERIERLTGQRIVERYGLSETLMNTAARADGARRAGFVGPPLEGVELRVRGEDGSEVAADEQEIGEIEVRGPNLFLGYLDRPDATRAALGDDGWFRTGDLGVRAADGDLRIVGRRSTDLIKTGGYRVGAGEVEASLLGHPAVEEAAVVGRPDPDLGERIVAFVVPAAGAQPSAAELEAHVAGELAAHKRPREVRFVAELPRNALGKLLKARLEP